jgi:hypothetical protein
MEEPESLVLRLHDEALKAYPWLRGHEHELVELMAYVASEAYLASRQHVVSGVLEHLKEMWERFAKLRPNKTTLRALAKHPESVYAFASAAATDLTMDALHAVIATDESDPGDPRDAFIGATRGEA